MRGPGFWCGPQPLPSDPDSRPPAPSSLRPRSPGPQPPPSDLGPRSPGPAVQYLRVERVIIVRVIIVVTGVRWGEW